MDTHRVVDVLDDRSADSLAAWLEAHPGVEVICRDRGGCYAEGAAAGAPDAIQVADRWHLLHNLSDAVYKVVAAHRRCLQPLAAPEPAVALEPAASAPEQVVEGLRAQRTRARHAEVQALREQGIGVYVIARRLGLDPKTVHRYADVTDPEVLIGPNGTARDSILDRFKPYLQQRYAAGVTATADLLQDIRARGFTGSERTLRRWLVDIRGRDQSTPAPPPVPRARDITGWIMRPTDKLTDEDRTELDRLCGLCPDLATLRQVIHGFTDMVRTRSGRDLPAWAEHAEQVGIAEIRSFVNGLRKDWDAVTAGLTMPWSSGAVEGNVNRIKMIKRQMFGRANPDLLPPTRHPRRLTSPNLDHQVRARAISCCPLTASSRDQLVPARRTRRNGWERAVTLSTAKGLLTEAHTEEDGALTTVKTGRRRRLAGAAALVLAVIGGAAGVSDPAAASPGTCGTQTCDATTAAPPVGAAALPVIACKVQVATPHVRVVGGALVVSSPGITGCTTPVDGIFMVHALYANGVPVVDAQSTVGRATVRTGPNLPCVPAIYDAHADSTVHFPAGYNPPVGMGFDDSATVLIRTQDCQIPNMAGMSDGDARTALAQTGLSLNQVTTQVSDAPVGSVISQSLQEGSENPPLINVVESNGNITVPNVVGFAEAAAGNDIRTAGLVVGPKLHVDDCSSPGDVVAQSPAGNTRSLRGTTVTLTVSTCNGGGIPK